MKNNTNLEAGIYQSTEGKKSLFGLSVLLVYLALDIATALSI